MDRERCKQELVRFLRTIVRPGHFVGEVDEQVNLVESGYIDSLAVIGIITWLETDHGVDLATLGIDPATLNTVGGILAVIEKAEA